MVLRMVRQTEDAEDLCQEVFMRVFRDIGKFRGESKLSTWVGAIAYNICIDHIRKKGREKIDFISDPAVYLNLSETNKPDRLLSTAETKAIVNDIIDRMPVHYRSVMVLFHLEEMSYKEIGEITGMPEGTIKSYLNRGREIIREKIIKIMPDIQYELFEADHA